MAIKDKRRNPWGSRLHFLVRFLGLTGLLAAGVAWFWIFTQKLEVTQAILQSAVMFEGKHDNTRLFYQFLAFGVAAAALALIIELLAALPVILGKRGGFGFNVGLQLVLAAALLVGFNVYSFQHYQRYDLTRDHKFTLPVEIRDQLKQLRGETTIVLYKLHKTFQFTEKPDAFDYAAEEKVTEKVQDLVDQFRELGPQFRVLVLDVKDEKEAAALRTDVKVKDAKDGSSDSPGKDQPYYEKLADLPDDLIEAIRGAPENSIFFYTAGSSDTKEPAEANNKNAKIKRQTKGQIQRLSFNDFYWLDKRASRANSNLVLRYQGPEPFARRVLNIDEKKPTIGVLVVHEWLTTEGYEDFGLAGAKKLLTARGFNVRDIILKKWSEMGPPEPAVYTYDESKFERLEEELAELDAQIKSAEEDAKQLETLVKQWTTSSLEDLTKAYAKQLQGRKVDEALRKRQLAFFDTNLALASIFLKQNKEERAELVKQKSGLNADEIAEKRRVTDLKAKLERSLADCDMVLIPRMTLRNVNVGDRIPMRVYKLDRTQVEAIKDFMKTGKPVLACFGPTNETPDRMDPTALGPDELESALSAMGFRFGNQTVLYNAESKSFAERRSGLIIAGAHVDIPPVDFAHHALVPGDIGQASGDKRQPNPLRESMQVVTNSLSKELDLSLRHPRPIYFDPTKPMDVDPDFMVTDQASWNESNPFPTREKTPRYEPTKADDPSKGTLDEKRRGPFPIGVAVETKVPADWYTDKNAKPASVRVAAIGHGGVFTGQELSPAKEQLLLNTCNWLLGRDDLLPKADPEREWKYPRVSLQDTDKSYWHWGTFVGLPGLFAYLGLVVLMVRRLR